jgi:hypothetical protein
MSSSTPTTACYVNTLYTTVLCTTIIVDIFLDACMVGALYLVRLVLATLTCAFVPDASQINPANASALRRLDCIDFGIDPPIPTSSASIVSSPFFYVHDGPDCVNFGIAPSQDDCLDTSPCVPASPSIWQPDHNYVDLDHL